MSPVKKEKWAGIGILSGCIFGAVGYLLLLYFGYGSVLAVILVSAAFFVLLGILGWIGWTIATTPAPKNIEGISKNLEEVSQESEEKNKDTGSD